MGGWIASAGDVCSDQHAKAYFPARTLQNTLHILIGVGGFLSPTGYVMTGCRLGPLRHGVFAPRWVGCRGGHRSGHGASMGPGRAQVFCLTRGCVV